VQVNAPVDARYDRRTASNGTPYFVLKGGNHEVSGQSEQYSSIQAREGGIEAVKREAPSAAIVDQA
jgi:uncharacterized protein YegP (UPF0339 family)